MARGFWTGLGHGAALSGATLVLLSLIWPLPAPIDPPVPATLAPAADAPRPAQPAVTAEPPLPQAPAEVPVATLAPPDEPEAADPVLADTAPGDAAAPSAEALGLPVGSEFGRGGDVAPRLPAPLAAARPRLEQSDAPAVSAPAAEPAPVAVTSEDVRPEAALAEPAPQRPAEGEASPSFARPASPGAPLVGTAPGMAALSGPDRLPGVFPGAEPPPLQAPTAVQPAPEEAPPPPFAAMPSPRLPAPGLDLSLPPDLSDLLVLERN